MIKKLKYIFIVIIILLNIFNKVYAQNVDERWREIDLVSEVLEKIQSEEVWWWKRAEIVD